MCFKLLPNSKSCTKEAKVWQLGGMHTFVLAEMAAEKDRQIPFIWLFYFVNNADKLILIRQTSQADLRFLSFSKMSASVQSLTINIK